ncbi:MAG: Xylan 1,4-beta-xylosidase precursor [Verrucomicrobia bacterium ADurb.Bin474]|nr:MAG: Xylan 1,4-beta-xylosidase precursor [Verrucomicrobia bacterium ADurb.Bin474]
MKTPTFTIRLAFTLVVALVAQLSAQPEKGSYLDPDLPTDKRVADLISKLTLEEKLAQLLHDAPGIERLGIPAYDWWNEALHGVARYGRATVFPQVIGLGATFDETLVHRIASAISDEARAKFNAAVALGDRDSYPGLTFWSPNINIFRDPRWGRGMETFGEDPYLTGLLGSAFVHGMQGDDPRYLKTAACAKHYAVHSGPESQRHSFDAHPPRKDLWESYLPAFEKLVREAKVEGVMCAYNAVFGAPCCGSDFLLADILQTRWGFEGYIVSDCWAIQDFHQNHKITADSAESAAKAIKSGVHLNCGEAFRSLGTAIERGLIFEREIDQALARILRTRFRLGLFDPVEKVSFNRLSPDIIGSESHVRLAREAAAKSIVLLKNDGVLPLSANLSDLLVVGPLAAHAEALLGNYYGLSANLVTAIEGITGKIHAGTKLNYVHGFPLLPIDNETPDVAIRMAREAPVTIVVIGSSPLLEGEEGEAVLSRNHGDRVDLNIPGNQLDYLRMLRKDNSTKIITVVMGGGPMLMKEVHELSDAVIFAWYPGEQGGNAIADVLFGDVNPSGRLPITFPMSADDLPPFDSYAMNGRTYRYATATPMYPFGFGLSYSQFTYSSIGLNRMSFAEKDPVRVSFLVANTSETEGEEVVQVYLHCVDAPFDVPVESLVAIRRVRIKPGVTTKVNVELDADTFLMHNQRGEKVFVPGDFRITVGGSAPSPRSLELGSPEPLSIVLSRE